MTCRQGALDESARDEREDRIRALESEVDRLNWQVRVRMEDREHFQRRLIHLQNKVKLAIRAFDWIVESGITEFLDGARRRANEAKKQLEQVDE